MSRFLIPLLCTLSLSTAAYADTWEAGAHLGFNSLSLGTVSTTGLGFGLRGGLRMKGGFTPEATILSHHFDNGNQVALGAGARYYFVRKREDIQPFGLAHIQLQTKTPSAVGLAAGGGAQYKIDKQFYVEALTTYHLSLGDAANIFYIGAGGGMKF